MRISPTDPRLRFAGAVSLQPGPSWVAPWRVPHDRARLHLPSGGLGRAAMPAGVRIALRTDSTTLRCRYQADPAPTLNGPQERPHLDVVVDGRTTETVVLDPEADEAELVVDLPGTLSVIELWLPTYHQFRLVELAVDDRSRVERDDRQPPRWVHDGSSISQGRGAASPSTTWVAQVARAAGLDPTVLALGAACHMQPMTARLMRDQPADLLSACVGINSQALGALSDDTFLSALIGFVTIVREAHPTTPIVIVSATFAPQRESVPGPSGLTIQQCRTLTARGVAMLREHGDEHVHYLDGLSLFGPESTDHFLEPSEIEQLHPDPCGHRLLAGQFLAGLADLGILPGGYDLG